jgi:hypothetical protein
MAKQLTCNLESRAVPRICPDHLYTHGRLELQPACWRCGSTAWVCAFVDVRGTHECSKCYKQTAAQVVPERKGPFSTMAPQDRLSTLSTADFAWMDKKETT